MQARGTHNLKQFRGALRALLMVVSLFCLLGQSYIAIGCGVHDVEHASAIDDCDPSGTEDPAHEHEDDCHLCCGAMGSGHACAHSVMMTVSSLPAVFVPQYTLVLPAL